MYQHHTLTPFTHIVLFTYGVDPSTDMSAKYAGKLQSCFTPTYPGISNRGETDAVRFSLNVYPKRISIPPHGAESVNPM